MHKQKLKTKWKRRKNTPFKGERLFNEEFGFFQIKKVWDCKTYSKNAVTPSGSHWFTQSKVFVVTSEGLKYQVPYIWLLFHSTNEKGKLLWKVIDGIE